MEQLKVKKKDTIIINAIVYLALSFLFLYLQYAYRHQLSPFSAVYLRKSAELFWYAAVPIVIASVLIWRHHKLTLWAYNFCIYLVGFKVVEGLFIEFNKIIVIALFFYAVISYFLYQLLSQYLGLASINPNYSANDLFGPLLKQIPCDLKWGESETVRGYLTNWDEEGCFIHIEDAKPLPSKVGVVIEFQGRQFTQEGEVVAQSTEFHGVGIKFEKRLKDLKVFNWSEFTELIHELGFQPKRLR